MDAFAFIVASAGSLAFGIVIAYLVRFFIWRYEEHSPKVLASTVGVLAGGAADGLAAYFLAPDPMVFWFYPLGLFVGFLWYNRVVRSAARNTSDTHDHDSPEPAGVKHGEGGGGGGGGSKRFPKKDHGPLYGPR